MRSRTAAVTTTFALALVAPLAFLATSAPASADVVQCDGQDATVVGTGPGKLKGTSGPDVIITNGATNVLARGGDDLVCITGTVSSSARVSVDDGAGDDTVIDQSTLTGTTKRPVVNVYLSGGDDSFVGNDTPENVGSYSGTDTISTGGGDDKIYVGRGTDGGSISGGAGVDKLRLYDEYGDVSVDLRDGTFTDTRGGGKSYTVGTDVERHDFYAYDLKVRGSDGPDDVQVIGCHLTVALGKGDDRLNTVNEEEFTDDPTCSGFKVRAIGGSGDDDLRSLSYPARHTVEGGKGDDTIQTRGVGKGGPGDDLVIGSGAKDHLNGGSGADVLRGLAGDDVLLGGPDRDEAAGGKGRDRCVAESRTACER